MLVFRRCTLIPALLKRLVLVGLLVVLATPARAQSSFGVTLVPAFSGFREPTDVVAAGDGSNRLFVVEKVGRVRVIDGTARRVFLDISSLVGSQGSEQGLLGLAFHPQYAQNGRFFVNYTDTNGDSVVAEYQVSADDPNVADPTTARQILFQPQPAANHNGGDLVFGPDGYLYIGFGDGGGGGDTYGNSQRGDVLLAKLLRIDVDNGDPYAIPPDNPFVNTPGMRPEIWAWGLRNPWRYSFDRATGDLYIGDVGQDAYEEIDFQPAGQGGQNYGWNVMEGLHCFRAAGCRQDGLTLPIAEYGHSQGCSVTGGYVYRGTQQPALAGAYLYADYCSGRMWATSRGEDGGWQTQQVADSGLQISTFGEDEAGEVFAASLTSGTIYRVTAA